MRAVVFHGVGDIDVDDVPEPRIEQPTDAVIRVTTAAICGTNLHMINLPCTWSGGTIRG